jgi:hypothetical protein
MGKPRTLRQTSRNDERLQADARGEETTTSRWDQTTSHLHAPPAMRLEILSYWEDINMAAQNPHYVNSLLGHSWAFQERLIRAN